MIANSTADVVAILAKYQELVNTNYASRIFDECMYFARPGTLDITIQPMFCKIRVQYRDKWDDVVVRRYAAPELCKNGIRNEDCPENLVPKTIELNRTVSQVVGGTPVIQREAVYWVYWRRKMIQVRINGRARRHTQPGVDYIGATLEGEGYGVPPGTYILLPDAEVSYFGDEATCAAFYAKQIAQLS